MKVKSCMKNTWHLLACLMLLVACSDDKVEDETTITLPPETETKLDVTKPRRRPKSGQIRKAVKRYTELSKRYKK